jgi:hypothetical protein
MFGLIIRMRRDEPRCGIPGRHDGYPGGRTAAPTPKRAATAQTGLRTSWASNAGIFVDNPFVDGFLEWMGSREGRQCIEVRDVLWDLLEDAELDAKQRQLIWPDAERLGLVQSIQRIQKLYPDLLGHEIEEVLLNWIDMGYDPENYSQAQLNELDSLTERWVADHLRNATASKTCKRTRHS